MESRSASQGTKDTTSLVIGEGSIQPNGYGTIAVGHCPDLHHHAKHIQTDPETSQEHEDLTPSQAVPGVWATLSVLLIGVFVSQTDQSLVLATYSQIASEFDDLRAGSWILSAAILAQCIAQPLYGKLSDIYGRKTCLQAAYLFFALGTFGCGVGRSLIEVVIARAVQGIGGAGMVSMVSIIITDLVPVHEIGQLRSYVNILQTTGRGCGGVIGGYLTGTIGWRAAFLIQVPPTLLAIALVQWRLRLPDQDTEQSAWSRLRRIDFAGAFCLCLTIGGGCFILDNVASHLFAMDSPMIIAAAVIASLSLLTFVVSARYATEPIFPLHILVQRAAFTNYAIMGLQIMMQCALTATVPLYIQATHDISVTLVGAYLIPAFAGNLTGGLLAGYLTKRLRIHKPITVLGSLSGTFCMILCLLVWQGGNKVNFAESLIIFPGGFSVGVVSSTTFVALAAGVAREEVAIAGSGMYTFANIGAIAGVSVGSAIYQSSLYSGLEDALQGIPNVADIIHKAVEHVEYVQHTEEWIKRLMIPAFVDAFHGVMSLISPGGRLRDVKVELRESEDHEDDASRSSMH
ncbi:hypothetical protein MRB53_042259 [Persea americana]|nr:hypothetical protein MRB53_042259 [Persea americana]